MTTTFDALTYALRPGFRPLLLDVSVPPGPTPPPVVVWLHGGAFLSGDRRFLPDTLAPGSVRAALHAAGLAQATVDYRLSGEARFPAQLEDVTAALDHLHRNSDRLGIDTNRLGVWGESAGALLAALVGLAAPPAPGALVPTGARPRAVVCWYPPTDLLAAGLSPDADDSPEALLLGGPPATRPTLAALASPARQVRPGAPPFLLVHGSADRLIPPSQSEALHHTLRDAGVDSTLRLVPGADHCFAGHDDPDALVRESVAFLERHLTSATSRS